MSIGRVFRKLDAGWEAIGEQLPTWDHVPPRPDEAMAVWVLPSSDGYQPGDVIAFAETAHRLVSPVPRDDVAWQNVQTQALMLHEIDEVRTWMAGIELWLCMRITGDWRT